MNTDKSTRTPEHFPATSLPDRCCYRFADQSRCTVDRDTHSFCSQHAKQIRRQQESPVGESNKVRFTDEYLNQLRTELESRGWQADARGDAECVDEASAAGAEVVKLYQALQSQLARETQRLVSLTQQRDGLLREMQSAADLLVSLNKIIRKDPLHVTAIDMWLAERALTPAQEAQT